MNCFKRRYSVIFSISAILILFAGYLYNATQSVYIMPWSTIYDVFSFLNWSDFTRFSLACILFSIAHWHICEEF